MSEPKYTYSIAVLPRMGYQTRIIRKYEKRFRSEGDSLIVVKARKKWFVLSLYYIPFSKYAHVTTACFEHTLKTVFNSIVFTSEHHLRQRFDYRTHFNSDDSRLGTFIPEEAAQKILNSTAVKKRVVQELLRR
jgi:hypothetical protein